MPSAPAPPRPPRPSVPRPARFGPPRPSGSLELDRRRIGDRGQVGELAPFVRWDEFLDTVRFGQGEHITIVGQTGSGKTVLGRELVKSRLYTVVLGTKNEDRELYKPFQTLGYELTDDFDPSPPPADSRVIFRPRLTSPDQRGLDRQAAKFEEMLFEVWEYGGWTLFIDELFTVAVRLKLAPILDTFWTSGRSDNVTVVGLTQIPVRVPRLAFDQATHIFLFRASDRDRINRMSDFAGADSAVLKALIPLLPKHEFLYVDTTTGRLLRSVVLLSR